MELSAVYSYNKATGGPLLLPLNLLSFLPSFLLAGSSFPSSLSDPHKLMITLDDVIAGINGLPSS